MQKNNGCHLASGSRFPFRGFEKSAIDCGRHRLMVASRMTTALSLAQFLFDSASQTAKSTIDGMVDRVVPTGSII